ncbi:MAG TPA: chemotaxis protein CheW [Spirochaetota bacterium]|nr:chemotaxis protein CheW [Spirochaetota bacterium]
MQTTGTGARSERVEEMQYITFSLADAIYGIEVLKAQEIVGMQKITHVPHSMKFMKGVINLRGMVIPLIDLRLKFGLPEKPYDKMNVIMVVQVKTRLIGIIVDSVSDVVSLRGDNIQDTVHFSVNIETDYISGIAEDHEKLIIIIDADKVFTDEELKLLDIKR